MSRSGDVPPLLGGVELPSCADVVTHNGRVVRFRGWVASTRGRSTGARVRLGSGRAREFTANRLRPDVIDAIGPEHGVTDPHVGFEFYVDLPRRRRPGTITIELTDGELATPPQVFRLLEPRPEVLETFEGNSAAKRELAGEHLEGLGLEFGALHQPLDVDRKKATVRYADRLTRAEALETFPELHEHYAHQLVDPDYIVDLDAGDLTSLHAEQFDFFIANDVIEHLANPLRFLESVHDVMRADSLFFLSAPDCDFTFDVGRKRTSFRHLLREYHDEVKAVDDAHIVDFIVNSEHESIPEVPEARAELITWHRDRSVHVHVWDQQSFDKLLDQAIAKLDLRFEIVDRATSREAAGAMVYILQKR